MTKVRRDNKGEVIPTLKQRIKSWWLGYQIRKGKLPRGRTFEEVHKAIVGTQQGECGEFWGILGAKHIRNGITHDCGVISSRKVTTAFRDYLVSSMVNSTTSPLDVFKYHGSGTNTAADANDQTALGNEVGTRATGNQANNGNAYIYRSVGTCNYAGANAITEHGLFSNSTNGTMCDRSNFAAINVVANDSIQFTYDLTFNAEA